MANALNLETDDTVSFKSFDAPVLNNPALEQAFQDLYAALDPDQLALVDQPPNILGAINANAGCWIGSTEVRLYRHQKWYTYTLKQAFEAFSGIARFPKRNWGLSPIKLHSLNEQTGRLVLNEVRAIVYSGRKPVYQLSLIDGTKGAATAEHPIWTQRGWVPLCKLTPEDSVAVYSSLNRSTRQKNGVKAQKPTDIEPSVGPYYPYGRHCKINGGRQTTYRARMHRLVLEATLNNLTVDQLIAATYAPNNLTFLDPKVYDIHHNDGDHHNNDPLNLEALPVSTHRQKHAGEWVGNGGVFADYGTPEYVKVVSIEPLGEQDTYDIQCADPHHSFIANKIVVHNSGKTHALITRAIRLALREQIAPISQVLITFTNKAARELQGRWDNFFEQHLTPEERRLYGSPWISTIHRFGHHLLTLLTGTVYTVLTDARATKLLRALKAVEGQTIDYNALNDAIDKLYAANELHLFMWAEFRRDGALIKVHNIATDAPPPQFPALEPEFDRWSASIIWTQALNNVRTMTPQKRQELREHYASLAGISVELFTAILLEYSTIKYQARTLDYSDMLYVAYSYLTQYPDARPTVWSRYRFFYVDEAQDCAAIDHALMSVSFGPDPKYILVGDSKQTLYRWRGAVPHVLDYLDRLYAKPIYHGKLTRNYRSTAQLVTLANKFASRFERRHLHESVPVKPAQRNALSIVSFDSHLEENTWIVRDIKDTINAAPKSYTYGDFVVLARANRSLSQIEASFIQQGVPYQIKTDPRQISKSPAYSFVHALYTLLINPRDIPALLNLAEQLHGIGPKARSKLRDGLQEFIAQHDSAPLWDAPLLQQRPFTMLETLHAAVLAPVTERLHTHTLPVVNNLFIGALTTQAYWSDFSAQEGDAPKPLKFTTNWAPIDRVFQLADLVYTLGQSAHPGIDDADPAPPDDAHYNAFLEVYALLTTSKDASELDDTTERVTLSTVHAFKGRQAKRIYYIHLNRTYLIPPSEEDDERCAAYVAFTRAQEKLTLTSSQTAPNFKMQPQPTYPNPFLQEYIQHVKDLMKESKGVG